LKVHFPPLSTRSFFLLVPETKSCGDRHYDQLLSLSLLPIIVEDVIDLVSFMIPLFRSPPPFGTLSRLAELSRALYNMPVPPPQACMSEDFLNDVIAFFFFLLGHPLHSPLSQRFSFPPPKFPQYPFLEPFFHNPKRAAFSPPSCLFPFDQHETSGFPRL